MLVEPPARGIRIGGVTVAPGTARWISIPLVPRKGAADDESAATERVVPAWAAVGPKAGPRVSVVAALRGYEVAAATTASQLAASIDPAAIAGSLVVVPVLRVGGQFAPGGRPHAGWTFPGDAGGTRRARDAFTLFSELVVGSSVFVVLGAPRPGRQAVLTVHGDLRDLRTRRLAAHTAATAALQWMAPVGSPLAAATSVGATTLELRMAGIPEDDPAREVDALAAAVRGILGAVGLLPATTGSSERRGPRAASVGTAPPLLEAAITVHAPAGGLLQAVASAGRFVRRGAVLANVVSAVGGRTTAVTAPRDGLILEATLRRAERKGATLFVLGPSSKARVVAGEATAAGQAGNVGSVGSAEGTTGRSSAHKVHVGWVENVALPNLGITRLKAKIDTGARTSALHVSRIRTVDTTGGPTRRPILEITVPSGHRGKKILKVRAAVREYVVVRDTSGRMERRPVIETTLQLGPVKKRIAVTLTNRGEMLYPMLIGRTALGPAVVVDPSRRYLTRT